MHESFELLGHSETGQTSTSGSSNADWTVSSLTLPPRILALKSTTHVVRSAFWTGLLTLVIVVGLSVLASDLPHVLAGTRAGDLLSKSISCDLQVQSGNSIQDLFIINIRGATHLTFTQAKAIDVIWQLFVGAGGRFVMAWVAYTVFMDGLTRQLEQTPVSYQVYASMTFDTNSLFAVWNVVKATYYSRGWRSKMLLAWFCLSTVYILGFPTLISATAGYLTPSTAGFKMTDEAGPPIYKYNVVTPVDNKGDPWEVAKEIQQDYPMFYALLNLTINKPPKIYDDTNSTRSYLIDGDYTTNFTLDGHFYRFHNYDFFDFFEDFEGPITASYCYTNRTLDQSFLKNAAQCLPDSYFVWGFSTLLVRIVLCLQVAWILGMYIVWLDANVYSALCRSGRKVRGHFRAAADLSEAMAEVLGKETCSYSDTELLRELQRQPGVRYYSIDAQDEEISHIGLSSRRMGRVIFNSTKLYGKHTGD